MAKENLITKIDKIGANTVKKMLPFATGGVSFIGGVHLVDNSAKTAEKYVVPLTNMISDSLHHPAVVGVTAANVLAAGVLTAATYLATKKWVKDGEAEDCWNRAYNKLNPFK